MFYRIKHGANKKKIWIKLLPFSDYYIIQMSSFRSSSDKHKLLTNVKIFVKSQDSFTRFEKKESGEIESKRKLNWKIVFKNLEWI